MTNYFLVEDDVTVLLMTDFVNLKIKTTQYFRCGNRDKVYVRVFIWVNAYIYVYNVLKKNY
jgi:hypothetical protein